MVRNFMQQALQLAEDNIYSGQGGPFGAVIVKDNQIVARGCNQVTSSNDPTAHAEIVTIRLACKNLHTFDLTGCEIYINCEPCPMCLAAIYWANINTIYYAATRKDAAAINFADDFIYDEIQKNNDERSVHMQQLMREEALQAFLKWDKLPNKITY